MTRLILTMTMIGCFGLRSFSQANINVMATEKVYITVLFYLKDNGQKKFDAFKDEVAVLYAKHHGKQEKIIKPMQLVKGDIKLPSEIHFSSFESQNDFYTMSEDPAYQKLVDSLRTPALENLLVIISKDAHSVVPQEIGDRDKFYAVTLLTIKEGEEHHTNFNNYLEQSCEIMSGFGAHFEKFLVPTVVQGNFEKPSKVHLFYFDSMDGIKKMSTDARMKALYPIRDKALKSAHLILGKAL